MKRLAGDRWFYHPTQKMYAAPEESDLQYESVFFESDGMRLHGWFFPAERGERAAPLGTVVHCHGNAGNITGHFEYVAWMPKRGWNVFVFDYRGFGLSDGSPSRPGTVADAHAAIDYVRSRSDVDAGRIVLFGQSLGGAVGITAAARRDDLRGVAIEGAFSNYRREARFVCGRSILLWGVAPLTRWLVAAGYDPIDSVGLLAPTPIFFITGTGDTICDPRQTLDMHSAAAEPKSLWVIDGGLHTGALVDTEGEGMRRLHEFFRGCISD